MRRFLFESVFVVLALMCISTIGYSGTDANTSQTDAQAAEARAKMNKLTSLQYNGGVCKPITINLDLDGDGTKEKYKMTSLLFCNGRNYVTPIKQQIGGSCITYAKVAALEATAYIRHDNLWPTTTLVPEYNKFSPIELSEGIAMFSNKGSELQTRHKKLLEI